MIGHWKAKYETNSDLPTPVENSATPQQVIEQLEMLNHLTQGVEVIRYRGWSNCRICGCINGTTAFNTRVGEIPKGLSHYITEHKVLVPGLLEV